MTTNQPTDPARLLRIDRAFDEVLASERERREALDDACGGDAELRAEVEELLEAADEPTSLVDRIGGALDLGPAFDSALDPGVDPGVDPVPSGAGEPPLPERIGAWRPTGVLGRGGMAVVYAAERIDGQFEQEVAIKVLGEHLSTSRGRRLFDRERRILASLQHPGIARLLDGGVTGTGHPYLVMERIRGLPIDHHCDAARLTIEERLRLFVEVAEAVQFAHGRLVLHRDLKPSNILVTGEGRVQLLDFGIAGLLRDDETADPTVTSSGLMTPEFASPEQAAGEPMTTASDVYQLGLVLYLLLTGSRAYAIDTRSPSRAERSIRDTEPPAPSTRLASRHGTLDPAWTAEAAAEARGERPGSLVRKLRGDLDLVTLKALRKEPARRYGSAAALAGDLERFLEGRPVTAHPDSLVYRARKFVGRHAFAVAAAVLALAAGGYHLAVVEERNREVTAERDRARLEATRANETRRFLVDLFEQADPESARGEDPTLRDVLEQGSLRIESELRDQPAIRAEMLATLGTIHHHLGHYDEAGEKLEQVAGHASVEPRLRLRSMGRLASLRGDQGRPEEARDLLERALAEARRELPDDTLLRASLLEAQATTLLGRDDVAARQAATEALRIRSGAHGRSHESVARTLNVLARIDRSEGDMEQALERSRESLRIREELYPVAHPRLAQSLAELGSLLSELGRREEALGLLERATELRRQIFGDDHPATAHALSTLGTAYRRADRLEEAEAMKRRSLAILQGALEPDNWVLAQAHNGLGLVLEDRGAWAEAEAEYLAALAIYPADVPNRTATVFNLASLRRQMGRVDEAVRDLRDLEDEVRRTRGPAHWYVAHIQAELGLARRQQQEPARALDHFDAARSLYTDIYGADSRQVAAVDLLAAGAHLDLAEVDPTQVDRAAAALERAGPLIEQAGAPGSTSLAVLDLARGRLAWARDDVAEARRRVRAAAEVLGGRPGPQGQECREMLAVVEGAGTR